MKQYNTILIQQSYHTNSNGSLPWYNIDGLCLYKEKNQSINNNNYIHYTIIIYQ